MRNFIFFLSVVSNHATSVNKIKVIFDDTPKCHTLSCCVSSKPLKVLFYFKKICTYVIKCHLWNLHFLLFEIVQIFVKSIMVFFYLVEDLSNGSKAETEIVKLVPLVTTDWNAVAGACWYQYFVLSIARDPSFISTTKKLFTKLQVK